MDLKSITLKKGNIIQYIYWLKSSKTGEKSSKTGEKNKVVHIFEYNWNEKVTKVLA